MFLSYRFNSYGLSYRLIHDDIQVSSIANQRSIFNLPKSLKRKQIKHFYWSLNSARRWRSSPRFFKHSQPRIPSKSTVQKVSPERKGKELQKMKNEPAPNKQSYWPLHVRSDLHHNRPLASRSTAQIPFHCLLPSSITSPLAL